MIKVSNTSQVVTKFSDIIDTTQVQVWKCTYPDAASEKYNEVENFYVIK